MKLGPKTKVEKRIKTTSKKFDDNIVSKLQRHHHFFQFMTNLEQSGNWIPDLQSVKITFSLIATFYLTKTENRTKKSLTQLSLLIWIKVLFLPKNTDIRKIKRALILKGITSETKYVCTNEPNFKFLAQF